MKTVDFFIRLAVQEFERSLRKQAHALRMMMVERPKPGTLVRLNPKIVT